MAEIKKINTELQPIDKLLDTSGDAGTSGQILSTTGSGTNWIDNTGGGGTVTGTGADEQVTYWTGSSVIDGDSGFKYNKSASNIAVVTIDSITSPQLGFVETNSAYTDAMRIVRGSDKLHLTYGHNANEEAITIVGGTGSDVGYVGIGTTTPDANLSITDSTINSKDIVYLKSGADNADEYLGLAFEIGGGGNGPHGAIRVYNGPSGSDSYMSLLTTTDGGTLTQGLTQDHLGNIGIGTNAPEEKLMVGGAIVSTGTNATSFTAGTNRAILDLTSGGARIGHFRGTTSAGSGSVKIYSDSVLALTIDENQDTTFAGDVFAAENVGHTGDTDTKMQFGTNVLKLLAGGATHFHAESDQTTHLYSGNALTLSMDTNQNSTFYGNITGITQTLTGTNSVLLTLNPTANSYGGIQFNYGGALKGVSMYNSGSMFYGGEAGVGLKLQTAGAIAVTIDTSQNATFAGIISAPSYLRLTNAINQATLPDVPDEHVITLNPPTTTGYYGGGISWSEGSNTAASIGVYDEGSGGALGMYFATGNNTTLTKALTLDDSGNATLAGNLTMSGAQILTTSGQNLALNPNTGLVTIGGALQCSGAGASSFVGNLSANIITATRDRSNTAGDIALAVNPDDSTIHYGFRIDQATNSFNLDRVDSAGQLLRVDASGNVTVTGDINMTDGEILKWDGNSILNHTGTSTLIGDNSSSAVVTISGGNTTFTGSVTGIAPTSNLNFATKKYVDDSISGTATYKTTWDARTSAEGGSGAGGNPDLTSNYKTNGWYLIVSNAGSATPNGPGTTPDSWHVGDWVIFNEDLGSSGEWQKIDNSSVISGAGTAKFLTKWDGTSGTSETLTSSLIYDDGTDVYINQGSSDYFGTATTVQISSGASDKDFGVRARNMYLYSYADGSSANLIFGDGSANFGLFSDDTDFNIYNYNTSSNALSILKSNNNATFAGDVTFQGGEAAVNVVGSGNQSIHVGSTSSGYARIYLDGKNGDFSGSDYIYIGQDDDGVVKFHTGSNAGNTIFYSKNVTNLTMDGTGSTFAGDVQVAGLYVGSTNTSYDFYNNGTTYLNGATTVDDQLTVSAAGTGNSPILSVTDTADTETAWFTGNRAGDTGAYIAIRHLPSTAAESNRSGIKFQAKDDGGNVTNYAQITQYIDDYTGGTEDGALAFSVIKDSAMAEIMRVDTNGLEIYSGVANHIGLVTIKGGEGADAELRLYADDADNTSDKWSLTSQASTSDLVIKSNTSTVLTLADGSFGATFTGDVTGSNFYTSEYVGHSGDGDTYIQFQADRQTYVAGGVEFIDFNEATQNYITVGGSGDIDTKLIGGTGYIFIQGSDGYIGINDITPTSPLDINANTAISGRLAIGTTPHATFKLDVLSTAADWAARIKNSTTDGYGLAVDCGGMASTTTYALAVYGGAGTGDFFVRNDGTVGIGTGTPQTDLQVTNKISVTTGGAYRMYNAAGTGWGEMNFNEVNNRVEFNRGINNSGSDWLLSENAVNSYVCANEGNFGIGTTAPSRPLSVHRDTAGSVANFLHYTDASNFAGLYMNVSQADDEVILDASGSSGGAFVFKQGGNVSLTLNTSLDATFTGNIATSGASKSFSFTSGSGTVKTTTGNSLILQTNSSDGIVIDGSTQNVTIANDLALTGGALSISGDGSNAATLTESSAGILTIATVDALILDSADDITLDAAGNDIRLFKAGVEYGKFKNDSGSLALYSSIDNEDIIFRGYDAGTLIDALTLDMSNGGSATFRDDIDYGGKLTQTGTTANTFNGDVTFTGDTHNVMWDKSANRLEFWDNAKLSFGDPGGTPDLELYHDASNSYIQESGTGSLKICAANFHVMNAGATEYMMTGTPNEGIILYYDNSQRMATATASVTNFSGGIDVTSTISGSDLTMELDHDTDNYTGTILNIGQGSYTAGKVYVLDETSWELSDANQAHTTFMMGLCIGVAFNEYRLLLNGIYDTGGHHGFTVGSPLYISASSTGDLTETAPSGSNDYVRVVGYALDDERIYFCPDNTWVKID